jgi:hypothetical protein
VVEPTFDHTNVSEATLFESSTTPLVEPTFEHISEPTLEIHSISSFVKQASDNVSKAFPEEYTFTTPYGTCL